VRVVDEWSSDWSSDSMRSTSNQSSNQTLSEKQPQESSIWETRTKRPMEVMVELCWRASLMCRAPSAPISLFCINEPINQSINESMKKKRMRVSESGWWLMSDWWVIEWLIEWLNEIDIKSIIKSNSLPKTPRILNMRDTYSKEDGGDGGVVLKSIADVSCSFCSHIVELYQWINESMKKKRMKVSESGWWLMSDWLIDRLTQWDRHQINHQIKLSPKNNPKNPQYETRTPR